MKYEVTLKCTVDMPNASEAATAVQKYAYTGGGYYGGGAPVQVQNLRVTNVREISEPTQASEC